MNWDDLEIMSTEELNKIDKLLFENKKSGNYIWSNIEAKKYYVITDMFIGECCISKWRNRLSIFFYDGIHFCNKILEYNLNYIIINNKIIDTDSNIYKRKIKLEKLKKLIYGKCNNSTTNTL